MVKDHCEACMPQSFAISNIRSKMVNSNKQYIPVQQLTGSYAITNKQYKHLNFEVMVVFTIATDNIRSCALCNIILGNLVCSI